MKENKIKITINRPAREVFEFTTNPKNTPLWIPNIEEEVADRYPPIIGTKYKNRGTSGEWDFYEVIELEENEIFTLKSSEGNYYVKYTYRELDEKTELEYYEWVETGELEKPFSQEVLDKLKEVIEN